MNPNIQPTSPWVVKDPKVLVGLDPNIAYRFAASAVAGNDIDAPMKNDLVNAPYVRRYDTRGETPIAPDASKAALKHLRKEYVEGEEGNILLELGKGELLKQPFDVAGILSKPVKPAVILGARALPEPTRLITAAATFEDAYFQEPGLITNQPMLLDANSRKTDANGKTSIVNFWNESGMSVLGESEVAKYFVTPESYFVYGRLVAISGEDALRKRLSSDSDKVAKPGVPSGPPAAIIPIATLLASIAQSQPGATPNLPMMVEEFLSKMLAQHPHLCNIVFDEAVFEIAIGLRNVGCEIVTVTVQRNRVQTTPAEREAFKKVYGSLGNSMADEKKSAAKKETKKSDSVSSLLQGPFVLGLDQDFNVAPANDTAASAAPVNTPSEAELAGSALAKMYSDDLYVATIVYKKGFDVIDINAGLSAWYIRWIRAAAPEARGMFAPHHPRKISFSNIRSDFASGRQPALVQGIQQYLASTSGFLGLKLRPLLDRYNPDTGEFDYVLDSIAGGVFGSNWDVSGFQQPLYTAPVAAAMPQANRAAAPSLSTMLRAPPSAPAVSPGASSFAQAGVPPVAAPSAQARVSPNAQQAAAARTPPLAPPRAFGTGTTPTNRPATAVPSSSQRFGAPSARASSPIASSSNAAASSAAIQDRLAEITPVVPTGLNANAAASSTQSRFGSQRTPAQQREALEAIKLASARADAEARRTLAANTPRTPTASSSRAQAEDYALLQNLTNRKSELEASLAQLRAERSELDRIPRQDVRLTPGAAAAAAERERLLNENTERNTTVQAAIRAINRQIRELEAKRAQPSALAEGLPEDVLAQANNQ